MLWAPRGAGRDVGWWDSALEKRLSVIVAGTCRAAAVGVDPSTDGRYAVGMDPLALSAVSPLFKSLLTRGVFARVGDAIEVRRARKAERAFQLLVDALVDADGLPPEEAAAHIERILVAGEEGVPDPHDTLYEAFRSFAFTRTEAAWPYIGRLTADYVAHRRRIDTLFRRAAWLLERCEEEDVVMLVQATTFTRDLLAQAADPEVLGVVWCGQEYADPLGIDYQHRPYGLSVNAAVKPGLDAVGVARLVPGESRGTDVLRLVQDARFARLTNQERIFISREHGASLAQVFRVPQ